LTAKLLFDQNLSRRLVSQFEAEFPGSRHVSGLRLTLESDENIWDYARLNGFCIISKDADFHQMSFLLGAPPKTIWLKLGNCSTAMLANCISRNIAVIKTFLGDAESALLVLQ
jgi:predicted nuclease of predicted toxin-antitoxin system